MPKVKLIEIDRYWDDSEDVYKTIKLNESDWEDVSDEELQLLQKFVNHHKYYDLSYILLRQVPEEERFLKVRDFIEKSAEKERLAEQLRKKCEKEMADKKAKAEANKLEKKRKQFEKLKKEFGE